MKHRRRGHSRSGSPARASGRSACPFRSQTVPRSSRATSLVAKLERAPARASRGQRSASRGQPPAVEAVVDDGEVALALHRRIHLARGLRHEDHAIGVTETLQRARRQPGPVVGEMGLQGLALARVPDGGQPERLRRGDRVEGVDRVAVDQLGALRVDESREGGDRPVVAGFVEDARQRVRGDVHLDALGLVCPPQRAVFGREHDRVEHAPALEAQRQLELAVRGALAVEVERAHHGADRRARPASEPARPQLQPALLQRDVGADGPSPWAACRRRKQASAWGWARQDAASSRGARSARPARIRTGSRGAPGGSSSRRHGRLPRAHRCRSPPSPGTGREASAGRRR